ncbi:hypothetical protein Naga_100541g5 [Nannochloropsis gaditana]|uniref:Uncharacterized protein n=1 Tax=Nannochloropsis gaditana TaxID=72520 RepID=W7UBJ1_9STRA|nr:hypothetical protein Naga_100541g5 [Nannochloropsis gaditana]
MGNGHNDRTVPAGMICPSHSLFPVLPARTLVGEWKGLRRNFPPCFHCFAPGMEVAKARGPFHFPGIFPKGRGPSPSLATGSRPVVLSRRRGLPATWGFCWLRRKGGNGATQAGSIEGCAGQGEGEEVGVGGKIKTGIRRGWEERGETKIFIGLG